MSLTNQLYFFPCNGNIYVEVFGNNPPGIVKTTKETIRFIPVRMKGSKGRVLKTNLHTNNVTVKNIADRVEKLLSTHFVDYLGTHKEWLNA